MTIVYILSSHCLFVRRNLASQLPEKNLDFLILLNRRRRRLLLHRLIGSA